MASTMKLPFHLHLHIAFLDYLGAFSAGTAILLAPAYMCEMLFYPDMNAEVVTTAVTPADQPLTIFSMHLFGFMLIVFAMHCAYHMHSPGMTLDKIRAILWMMLWGDLLHLYVYYVGCTMNVFVGGVLNAGVLPNVVISSYAAVSRIAYLYLPSLGVTAAVSRVDGKKAR